MKKKRTIEESKAWFLSKTKKGPNGCLYWTGPIGKNPCLRAKTGPWNQKRYNLVSNQASRAAYALFKPKEFDPSLLVLHNDKCNPKTSYKCVNVDHLYQGTAKQNANDRYNFGFQDHGEDHQRARFTNKQVKRMRKLYSKGMRISEIIKTLDEYVSSPEDELGYHNLWVNVHKIVTNKTWDRIK